MPTKAELRALLANWPIDQRLRIQPIPILHGERMSDTSFGVGDEFVLKLYTDRATLTRVLTITRALEAQGLKAASPIMTRDKQAFVEGDTLAALLRRVPGEPLPMAERYGARLEDCAAKTGQALARLHLALKAIESDIPADEANLYRTCEDWALPIARKQDAQWNLGLGDAFFGDYVSGFEALCGAMPRQLIHRDPNPSNILFSAGEVCGFIDFDLYERNVRLFDPCYSATGILSESGDDPQRYEKWPGILHGYDAVSPLTDEEKRAVYYVLCSIQMIFCAYCAEFEDATMQQLAATNRRMLTFIVSKRESIERMF